MCPYTYILEDMNTIQIAYVDDTCLMMYGHNVYDMSKGINKKLMRTIQSMPLQHNTSRKQFDFLKH